MGDLRSSLSADAVHLCIDMQCLFAPGAPWATPWMPRVSPVVLTLVEYAPAATIFTRSTRQEVGGVTIIANGSA